MRIHAWAAVLLLVGAAGPPVRGDEEYDGLRKDFEQAQQDWFKQYTERREKAGKDGEVDLSDLPRPERQFRPRFRGYAEKHAGTPEAIPALVWLVGAAAGGQPDPVDPDAKWAIETLTRAHAADPAIGKELRNLQYTAWSIGRKPLLELYERVIASNQDREAVAAAKFGLAFTLYSDSADPAQASAGDRKRAEALFREVAKDYASTKVAEAAAGYVFELEHLQVGMVAPDFEGEDADGKKIKLSDFRGKVVVVDFWGFW